MGESQPFKVATELSLLIRVMMCVEAYDLREAGVSSEAATAFAQDPFRSFVRMGDADAKAAFGLIATKFAGQLGRARQRAATSQEDADRA